MGKMIQGDRVFAAGVLLFRAAPQPHFLLMQHPTRWDLPKGHAEPGETLQETALREMHEETGIDPQHVWLDPDFRWRTEYPVTYKKMPGRVFRKEVTIFLGRLLDDIDVGVTEHAGFRWVPWNPPHRIQDQTIDPLLAAVEEYLQTGDRRVLEPVS